MSDETRELPSAPPPKDTGAALRLADLVVCPQCGAVPVPVFDIVEGEIMGWIKCSSCGNATARLPYEQAKARWNGDGASRGKPLRRAARTGGRRAGRKRA